MRVWGGGGGGRGGGFPGGGGGGGAGVGPCVGVTGTFPDKQLRDQLVGLRSIIFEFEFHAGWWVLFFAALSLGPKHIRATAVELLQYDCSSLGPMPNCDLQVLPE